MAYLMDAGVERNVNASCVRLMAKSPSFLSDKILLVVLCVNPLLDNLYYLIYISGTANVL